MGTNSTSNILRTSSSVSPPPLLIGFTSANLRPSSDAAEVVITKPIASVSSVVSAPLERRYDPEPVTIDVKSPSKTAEKIPLFTREGCIAVPKFGSLVGDTNGDF